MISLRTWSVIALGAIGVGAACSPTVGDPLPIASSGGAANMTGSGGQQLGMASGGSGTAASSGGATGAGATTGSSGGAAASGSGGSAAAAVECTGTGAITMGHLDNGTVCGFGWTGAFPDTAASTIEPPCGTAGPCFDADTLCTSGTLVATDADAELYTGVMIGVNAATNSDGSVEGTWSAAGSIAVEFTTGGLTGEPRIILQSGSTDYCVPNAVSGMAYPVTSFATECWGSTGTALAAGTAIDNIIVQVNGSDADEMFTDFCVNSITNM